MFYSSDILSRRRGGLGVIWLAATIGDRAVFRKLTKRDILTVNVSQACQTVASPPEPLALRLSGQLMYGVVRIYVKQNELWMQDVQNTHLALRRNILAISIPAEKEPGVIPAIDMSSKLVRPDAITMPVDTAFYSLDFDPIFDLTAAREPVGIGEARYVAPPERITLPVPFYEEEAGVPRAEVEEGFPEFAPSFEEEGFEPGLDLGLEEPVEFAPEELPLPIEAPPPPEAVVPEVRPPPKEEEVAPPRPPKRVRIFEDRQLELSDEEMRASRENYSSDMERQKARVYSAQQERQNARLAHDMVFGPPADMASAPMLVEFWSMTVGANLKAVDDHYKAMKSAAVAAVPPPVPPPEEEMEEMLPLLEEVGRALSPRAAELPWNIFIESLRREESIAPGMETVSEIAAREFAIETPTGLRRAARRVTPVSPVPELWRRESVTASIEGFELEEGVPFSPRYRTPSVSLEEARLRPIPPPEEVPSASQIFMEDLETETRNFFEYARSVRDQLEDPTFFFFSDLAPVASSSPNVAAQAFYHVLALTSSRRLRVRQDESYGEINIQIVE